MGGARYSTRFRYRWRVGTGGEVQVRVRVQVRYSIVEDEVREQRLKGGLVQRSRYRGDLSMGGARYSTRFMYRWRVRYRYRCLRI